MRFTDVIEQFNREAFKIHHVDIDLITSEVGIKAPVHQVEHDITAYWLVSQIDGDTEIGIKAYYLNDMLCAVSHQDAKHLPEQFQWYSVHTFIRMKEYIASMDIRPDIDLISHLEQVGSGVPLLSNTSYKGTHVIYRGKPYRIDNEWRGYSPENKTMIKLEAFPEPVNISECLAPYNIIS